MLKSIQWTVSFCLLLLIILRLERVKFARFRGVGCFPVLVFTVFMMRIVGFTFEELGSWILHDMV